MALIERLKLNQVPQNTPATSAKSITLTNCRILMLRIRPATVQTTPL